MNLYMASTLCWGYSVEESIRIAKKLGLKGVEVWTEHVIHRNSTPASIAGMARRLDMPLTLHAASWDLNICSVNTGILQQSIAEIKKSIILADVLDARNMTIHPGYMSPRGLSREKYETLMVESLKFLADFAGKYGVTISIEMMEKLPKELITEPEMMNSLLKKLPGSVRTTFDVAHVPVPDSPVDYYKQLKRISKIHLSDSSLDAYHVPLGEGNIELDPFLQLAAKDGMPIVLEGLDTCRSLGFLGKHLAYLHKNGWLEEKSLEHSHYK